MRNLRVTFVFATFLLVTMPRAFAIDANQWRDLGDERRRGYVTAVVDTWFNFHALMQGRRSSGESTIAQVVDCIRDRKLNYNQIYTAAEDYVERRKDRREYNMAAVTWNAVSEMCKR